MARRTSKCQRGGEATRFERLRLPSCTPALWPWPQGASFRAAAGEEHRCADTMVSIAGNRLSRWRARRRSLANGLLVGHVMGLDLVDMAWLVVRYRRAQREVSLSLERRRRIRAASFNLNAFSTQQSLSLFRFSPVHIGHLVDMLEIYVDSGAARLSVTVGARGATTRCSPRGLGTSAAVGSCRRDCLCSPKPAAPPATHHCQA